MSQAISSTPSVSAETIVETFGVKQMLADIIVAWAQSPYFTEDLFLRTVTLPDTLRDSLSMYLQKMRDAKIEVGGCSPYLIDCKGRVLLKKDWQVVAVAYDAEYSAQAKAVADTVAGPTTPNDNLNNPLPLFGDRNVAMRSNQQRLPATSETWEITPSFSKLGGEGLRRTENDTRTRIKDNRPRKTTENDTRIEPKKIKDNQERRRAEFAAAEFVGDGQLTTASLDVTTYCC
jgi:hypothetical protein